MEALGGEGAGCSGRIARLMSAWTPDKAALTLSHFSVVSPVPLTSAPSFTRGRVLKRMNPSAASESAGLPNFESESPAAGDNFERFVG